MDVEFVVFCDCGLWVVARVAKLKNEKNCHAGSVM